MKIKGILLLTCLFLHFLNLEAGTDKSYRRSLKLKNKQVQSLNLYSRSQAGISGDFHFGPGPS